MTGEPRANPPLRFWQVYLAEASAKAGVETIFYRVV